MKRFVVRLLASCVVVAVVFIASRALVRTLPGDPLETALGETGTSLPVERVRQELGLDVPFMQALVRDARRALHGDLGISLISRRPVAPLLAQGLFRTALLASLSLFFALGIALVLGLSAAGIVDERKRQRADRLCLTYGALVSALPTPWIGPMLMLVFCVWIPILPTGGNILLPAITLALGFAGFWARLLRDRVGETLRLPATAAARARGVPEWKIVIKYGLAPCAGALLAYLGTQAGGMIAGAFVTEAIFNWHGMGLLLVDAVLKRDYPVVEWAIFATALASLGGTVAGDSLQRWADPRLRE